jgi:excisionase family DNA binding protein
MKWPDRATISIKELAELLGVTYNAARKGVAEGTIPHVKMGRKKRIPTAIVRRLFEPPADGQD